MMLDLKDFLARGHTLQLFFDPGTEFFDDIRYVIVELRDGWVYSDNRDGFQTRSVVIQHAVISAISYLNLTSDVPLSIEWLSEDRLDLDAFFRAGHRLELSAQDAEMWSRADLVWWVNVGYEGNRFYVEYDPRDKVYPDDAEQAFDIGMQIIAELDAKPR